MQKYVMSVNDSCGVKGRPFLAKTISYVFFNYILGYLNEEHIYVNGCTARPNEL